MKLKNTFSYMVVWLFAVVMLIGTQTAHAQGKDENQAVFRAGAATANITPFLGGGIVGGWGTPPAEYVHDELHARCLVLDDGTTKLVFIIVDNVGLPFNLIDKAKRIIQEETGIKKENIMISATHTHSAVSGHGKGEKRREFVEGEDFDEYQTLIIRRIADVARIALVNLEPAEIGWGVGSVPQHVFVRRWKMKPGTPMPNPFGGEDKVVMNPGHSDNLLEPAAEPDPEVSFISVRSSDGKPIALLANYSLHYVGYVGDKSISADYFAMFADRIQELLKSGRQDPPFVGIMSNGTSGNVNNNNYAIANSNIREPYVKMRMVADDVAEEVFRVHKEITFHKWVPLAAAAEELKLHVRKPSPKELSRAEEVINKPETYKPVHRHEVTYAHRLIKLRDEWPNDIDVVLQTFRIGDLGVAAIPFEVFAQIGMDIKAKSPFKQSFTVGLANGLYGYLPTPEEHKLGGYETWYGTNNVEFEASTKIVTKLMDLFSEIDGK
ncbi:hypothetical protein [Kriegella aquimaris]|uniref:Neutral/alkaline non-lysosomal ceramidase, N-terminal n=1 Tax=Kriegella aquimaris TaxID=192904 RepID=A0A1G9VGT7_9FLAO|nr:hypothetical protein [Kriegella aquimaris]SDM71293.1 hypothetical protein SAMN04488514_11378 [Kriegella aquimaris]